MTSHHFHSFSNKNCFIFLEHSGFPVVTFLSIIIKKTSVEANINVAAIFTQHFVSSIIVHNWSFCDNCVYLIDLQANNLGLDNATYMPINQQVSLVVESLLRNPWIGGSNPGGNYISFSVSRRMNPFSSENVHFVPLMGINVNVFEDCCEVNNAIQPFRIIVCFVSFISI